MPKNLMGENAGYLHDKPFPWHRFALKMCLDIQVCIFNCTSGIGQPPNLTLACHMHVAFIYLLCVPMTILPSTMQVTFTDFVEN